MRITDLRTFVVGNPPPHFGGRYFVFLKLLTDAGVEGVGEVYGVPFGPHTVARMIQDVFERYVLGADPFKIERLWRIVYSAGYSQRPDLSLMGILSGIEMACWDIVGKELGKPVYELLGGRVHERLRSYSYLYPEPGDQTCVYRDPELAAVRAAEYVAKGFSAVKFDPVGPYTAFDPRQLSLEALEHTERFVRMLREAVGGRCDLLFGTHGQMTAAGAIRLARRLEPYDPLWFEEPTPPEMPEEMAKVAQHTSDPDRDRRATGDQIRVRARAPDRGRLDPADGARESRRPARSEEDRRHGRGALRPDRAAPLLRPDRGRGQHPDRDLQPEFSHTREHPDLGRLPRRDSPDADRLGGRLRGAAGHARPRRRARTRRSRRAIPTAAKSFTSTCTTGRSDLGGTGAAMRLGFVGLGNLGAHLARSLLRAGFTVTVHDLERERASGLIAAGAAWGASPREVAAQADSVITCLPSPAAVAAVVEAADGVLAGLRPGGTWIDMSTNDPDEIRRLAARAAARGIGCLEAPVTGGVHKAASGEITVLVGGEVGGVRGPPAGLRGDGRQGAAHGPARQRLGDQGDHQHAGVHPSGRVGRSADAGQARRARPGEGLRSDPGELRQQLRSRDREPGDPLGQLRHRLHDGSRVQGSRPRAPARQCLWRAARARGPGRADLRARAGAIRRQRLVADGGQAARGRARHRAARAGLSQEPATAGRGVDAGPARP